MSNENEKHNLDLNDKIMKMALTLSRCYIDGYTSLKLIYEILEIQSNMPNVYLTAPSFYNSLYGVCYQSTIINLSNILVNNKDSIEIYYFKSCFNNLIGQNHPFDGHETVEKSINKIISNYPKGSDFYLGLKELRDRYIVHIDKSKFNSYSGLDKKITLEEIKKAYDCVGNLIETFFGALGINPELVDFDQLDKANIQFRIMINNMKVNPII